MLDGLLHSEAEVLDRQRIEFFPARSLSPIWQLACY